MDKKLLHVNSMGDIENHPGILDFKASTAIRCCFS